MSQITPTQATTWIVAETPRLPPPQRADAVVADRLRAGIRGRMPNLPPLRQREHRRLPGEVMRVRERREMIVTASPSDSRLHCRG